jgi:hypothetical protein
MRYMILRSGVAAGRFAVGIHGLVRATLLKTPDDQVSLLAVGRDVPGTGDGR